MAKYIPNKHQSRKCWRDYINIRKIRLEKKKTLTSIKKIFLTVEESNHQEDTGILIESFR